MNLDSTKGDNWTVIVLRVDAKRWQEILIKIHNHFENLDEASLPHYTIRGYSPGQIIVSSFRILRNIKDETKIIDDTKEFMKSIGINSYRIDPDAEDDYGKYHAWFRKGQVRPHWTIERCIVLNHLSSLVLKAAENNVFNTNSRAEFAHLAVNMLGVHEAVKNSQSYYFDTLTGTSKGPYVTKNL